MTTTKRKATKRQLKALAKARRVAKQMRRAGTFGKGKSTTAKQKQRKTKVTPKRRPTTRRVDEPITPQDAFALGHCRGWLDAYAAGLGDAGVGLARRVGELLLRA